jgi:hypothetical protein
MEKFGDISGLHSGEHPWIPSALLGGTRTKGSEEHMKEVSSDTS